MTVPGMTHFIKTPIEDLYPNISDKGHQLCQQWIEKYNAGKSLFYEVAELVKAEVDQWTLATGEKPTYPQIRQQLFANDLIKKF